jgi:hypothetical protein
LVFLVADGGHIPWSVSTDQLARGFRFAVARGTGEFTLLISASTALDSAANGAFLQVLGWDPSNAVFHYYERLDGTFFWAGMSPHALADGTRGKGPFDSHVNGSLGPLAFPPGRHQRRSLRARRSPPERAAIPEPRLGRAAGDGGGTPRHPPLE